MAPRKPIKTYIRKSSLLPLRKPNSVDVFDALFAANLSSRRQLGYQNPTEVIAIKELPAPDENHHLLQDSISFSFNNADDTFDKLRKEPPLTNVGYYKLPVNTLTNSCAVDCKELSNDSKCDVVKGESCNSIKDEVGFKSTNEKLFKLPAHLEESVNESLCVEPENAKCIKDDFSTLDDTGCSVLKVNDASPTKVNVSTGNLFSKTFKEANAPNTFIIASTPVAIYPSKTCSFLPDSISPIVTVEKNDAVLLESYREIFDWSYIAPSFDKFKVNKSQQQRLKLKAKSKVVAKGKCKPKENNESTQSEGEDWKLKEQPFVQMDKCLDIIGVGNSVKLDDIPCKGWMTNKVRESTSTSLYMQAICDTYQKSVLKRSTQFLLSTNKRPSWSRKSSLPSNANSTKKKNSVVDLNTSGSVVAVTNECSEDAQCSIENSINSSASLFTPEKTETSATTNKSAPNLQIISTPLDLNNSLQTSSTSSSSSNIINSSWNSQTNTPSVPTKRRPIQIAYEDFNDLRNITQTILSPRDQYDALDSVQNDHSYSCTNFCESPNDDSDTSVISVSDEEDICSINQSIMLLHNYSRNTDDSIPVIDLTDEVDCDKSQSSTTNDIPGILELTEMLHCFNQSVSFDSNHNDSEVDDQFTFVQPALPLERQRQYSFKSGKSFRRSLLNFKKSFLLEPCAVDDYDKEKYKNEQSHDLLETITEGIIPAERLQLPVPVKRDTACEIILTRCGQKEPLPFGECYTPIVLNSCRKIGEGVYGEVFEYFSLSNIRTVMKIIPIEGELLVNGEHQKKYEEIISEIVTCMELSKLRYTTANRTCGFSEVYRVRCVKGSYPDKLKKLWQEWNKENRSENDYPSMFKQDQLYIVLELAHGGADLEEYVFKNALQTLSLFKQMAFSLAVAESSLKFEHRDLHWGNVLINTVDPKRTLTFHLDNKEFNVESYGVEASIIDFTLSRITYDGACIFNDLSLDPELFVAQGDYQYEIYRLMKTHIGNQWSEFDPYTNILWLHYTIDKMIKEVHYKYNKTKIHITGINELKQLKDVILDYKSVKDLVLANFITETKSL